MNRTIVKQNKLNVNDAIGILCAMDDKNTLRIITPLPETLVLAVDDYRFGNRFASRAAAIRALLEMGLEAAAQHAEPNK